MLSATFKEIETKPALSRLFLAWLILFCVIVGLLPVFGNTKKQLSDTVFCPLQKKWVKQNPTVSTAPIKNEKPLEDVCASSRHKENFISDLSKNLRLGRVLFNQASEINLFFKYVEIGKKAFAEIAAPYNSPEQQLVISSRTEKSGINNYQKDFGKIPVEPLLTRQFPRPPTASLNTVFINRTFRELKNISRNINPRSPPFSI